MICGRADALHCTARRTWRTWFSALRAGRGSMLGRRWPNLPYPSPACLPSGPLSCRRLHLRSARINALPRPFTPASALRVRETREAHGPRA